MCVKEEGVLVANLPLKLATTKACYPAANLHTYTHTHTHTHTPMNRGSAQKVQPVDEAPPLPTSSGCRPPP